MRKLNCFIFDDHPLICSAVKNLISELDCIKSVESSCHAKTTLKEIKSGHVDLLILDVNLSDCNGYDFLRRIKSHGYDGKVLFFSAEANPLYSETAFNMGAHGYVCKSENYNILKDAVEGIASGYSFFKIKANNRPKEPRLSHRESFVLNQLLEGKTNKEIAQMLSISEKTISTYKARIKEKYNVRNIIELTKLSEISQK